MLEDTGFFKNKCEELADYMKELPDYLYLVFAETEVDKRNRMYKAVKACGSMRNLSDRMKNSDALGSRDPGESREKDHQRDMELLLTKNRN